MSFFVDKLDQIFTNYSDEEITFVANGFADSDFNQNGISDLIDIIYEPDGTLTEGLARFGDHDTDGIFDPVDPDFTGIIEEDTDGDGIADSQDPDIDGDFVSNEIETELGLDPRNPDFDGDGLIDYADWLTDVWLNEEEEPQNVVSLDSDIRLVQDLGGRAMSLCDSEDVCSIIHTEIPSLDYLKQVFLNQGYNEQIATQSAVFYQKNFLDKEIRNTALRMAEFLRRHSNEVSDSAGGQVPVEEIALLADYLPVAAMSTEWKNIQPHLNPNITWDYTQNITPEMLAEALQLKSLGHINGYGVGDSFSESTLAWIEATNSDPSFWVNFDDNPDNDK
ncbi:hypothetical protein GF362_03075 [Candidatus Dojkabacteria bacterium]|nr:hypothetical protein [Candidatus Dojkabacteria bacterium]